METAKVLCTLLVALVLTACASTNQPAITMMPSSQVSTSAAASPSTEATRLSCDQKYLITDRRIVELNIYNAHWIKQPVEASYNPDEVMTEGYISILVGDDGSKRRCTKVQNGTFYMGRKGGAFTATLDADGKLASISIATIGGRRMEGTIVKGVRLSPEELVTYTSNE